MSHHTIAHRYNLSAHQPHSSQPHYVAESQPNAPYGNSLVMYQAGASGCGCSHMHHCAYHAARPVAAPRAVCGLCRDTNHSTAEHQCRHCRQCGDHCSSACPTRAVQADPSANYHRGFPLQVVHGAPQQVMQVVHSAPQQVMRVVQASAYPPVQGGFMLMQGRR